MVYNIFAECIRQDAMRLGALLVANEKVRRYRSWKLTLGRSNLFMIAVSVLNFLSHKKLIFSFYKLQYRMASR